MSPMKTIACLRHRFAGAWIVAGASLCLFASAASAKKPEYMKLDLEPGLTLEIKGKVNSSGLFVASDLEKLDKPRRPKLRGAIGAFDPEANTLEMFGMTLHITSDTEFLTEGAGTFGRDGLKDGARVEVSCKVKDGRWIARKITGGAIKDSDKIKATVTGVRVDGTPPDTLDIDGLLILLDEKTDHNSTDDQSRVTEELLYRDLASRGPHGRWVRFPGIVDGVWLGAEYRHNYRSLSEFDLSRAFQSDIEDMQPEVRLTARGFLNRYVQTFAQFRARKKYVVSSDLQSFSPDVEAHFTQLYVLVRDVGLRRLALQVGRQKFKEPREWLYDEYQDALRVYFHTRRGYVLEAAVLRAINPIKEKHRTWTDYFAMLRWTAGKRSYFGTYILRRTDTSSRVREPIYWGLRYHGDYKRSFRPWMDFAVLRGEDKGRALRAWAIDLGATMRFRQTRFSPALTVQYAYGSGDDTGGDDLDHKFRQTGYEDNTTRFGGLTSVRYYGAVLEPELSNLEIVTVAAAFRPTPRSSIEVLYHRYRQAHPDDEVEGSGLVDPPARPNGVSTDIGWGADLVVGSPNFWGHVRLTWTLGMFVPGEAFAPRQERAYLQRFQLIIQL